VIPGPLVGPALGTRTGGSRAALAVRVVAVALIVGSVAGALAWYSVLSPFTMHRWQWELSDTLPALTVKDPGRYVIFEEGSGLSTHVGPPLLSVKVVSIGGRKIDTTSALDASGRSTQTYRTPWHEGRAIAIVDIDRPGNYDLFTYLTPEGLQAANNGVTGTRSIDVSKVPAVALAPDGSPGVLGGMAGLLVLTLGPLLVGVGLLIYAAGRWPSPLRRPRRTRSRRQARAERRAGRAAAGAPGVPQPAAR